MTSICNKYDFLSQTYSFLSIHIHIASTGPLIIRINSYLALHISEFGFNSSHSFLKIIDKLNMKLIILKYSTIVCMPYSTPELTVKKQVDFKKILYCRHN